MREKLIYPFIVGCCLMAVGASSKAILDVAVLKKDNDNIHTTLKMLHYEIREMRSDIKQLIKRE